MAGRRDFFLRLHYGPANGAMLPRRLSFFRTGRSLRRIIHKTMAGCRDHFLELPPAHPAYFFLLSRFRAGRFQCHCPVGIIVGEFVNDLLRFKDFPAIGTAESLRQSCLCTGSLYGRHDGPDMVDCKTGLRPQSRFRNLGADDRLSAGNCLCRPVSGDTYDIPVRRRPVHSVHEDQAFAVAFFIGDSGGEDVRNAFSCGTGDRTLHHSAAVKITGTNFNHLNTLSGEADSRFIHT